MKRDDWRERLRKQDPDQGLPEPEWEIIGGEDETKVVRPITPAREAYARSFGHDLIESRNDGLVRTIGWALVAMALLAALLVAYPVLVDVAGGSLWTMN